MNESLQELEARLKGIEETAERDEMEAKFAQELKNYKGIDEVISFKDVKDLPPAPFFSSGLRRLDMLIEGFHECDLIVVTGPTGQGKTTLLQTFTINLSKQSVKSLWFTYEVSLINLLRKFGNDLPDGYAPKVLSESSIIWIERKIVESMVKFGVKAVFIDPFNSLIRFSSPKLSQELGDLAERIKQMAIKYNIIIIVSAHARKLGEDEVMSEDIIRDTALLASKADSILTLWRGKEKQHREEKRENGIMYKNESTVSVVKNRLNGNIGSLKVIHDGNKFLTSDSSIQ
jgi:replicative DNA helicase